jgi:hypothetical protein
MENCYLVFYGFETGQRKAQNMKQKPTRGGKREGAGRPASPEGLQKRRNLTLSDYSMNKARLISSNNNASEGVRIALEAYKVK